MMILFLGSAHNNKVHKRITQLVQFLGQFQVASPHFSSNKVSLAYSGHSRSREKIYSHTLQRWMGQNAPACCIGPNYARPSSQNI